MSCAFPHERLVDLARSHGDGQEAMETLRHVASCPACARELESLRKLLKAVREAPVALPSADFTARVMREAGRIRRAELQAAEAFPLLRFRPWWQRPWAATAAAASLTASVSVGLWWSLLEGRPEPLPSLPPGSLVAAAARTHARPPESVQVKPSNPPLPSPTPEPDQPCRVPVTTGGALVNVMVQAEGSVQGEFRYGFWTRARQR